MFVEQKFLLPQTHTDNFRPFPLRTPYKYTTGQAFAGKNLLGRKGRQGTDGQVVNQYISSRPSLSVLSVAKKEESYFFLNPN
jgi:hypothetical protein